MPVSVNGASRLVAGIDLGSTSLKLLVADEAGTELVTEQVPTPWRGGLGGTTELDAAELARAVGGLLASASASLAQLTDAPVRAVAVAGMGETGMLVDTAGLAVAPAFAWYDPRGAAQVAAFPERVRAQFPGRTGLPLGAQVSVAKLAYLRDGGLRLAGLRWLNLPEFVAALLGGRAALEYSLTSRTGLLDQDTGEPWTEMLDLLGVPATFLPPRVDAGALFGRVQGAVPPAFAGAVLTVAGHDHLVAAEAGEPLPLDHYHVSMGTAEVLLRVIDAPLGREARARLAEHLINEVRHVVPGRHVLVAGVKSGLLMRRALQLAGISDRSGRDSLDAEVMRLPFEGGVPADGVVVSGARNDDGVLRLTIGADGVTPAELFGAVLRHGNDEIAGLIRVMERELPPARTAALTGGWAGMASVRRARRQVLPPLAVSTREQATAYGAARVAVRLLPQTPTHLTTDLPTRTATEGLPR